ncbi:MAG: hypothetical protein PHX74_01920 [Candidatus Sumerlaeales bacterium]|nr:hypothetical protein [Candidatus Sumerlaeales bacterium]
MTQEQAIEVLISRYNSGVIRSRTNDDEWRLATDAVIVALLGPQPDPITGLVPCGVCGKSPTYEEFNDGFFDLDRVECRGCGVMVTSACGKSKAEWNAMRGYKEADE